MPSLEFTPEQRQVVIGSEEPVPVFIPETQQTYVVILAHKLHALQTQVVDAAKKMIPGDIQDSVEYRYHDIRDDVPDEP